MNFRLYHPLPNPSPVKGEGLELRAPESAAHGVFCLSRIAPAPIPKHQLKPSLPLPLRERVGERGGSL